MSDAEARGPAKQQQQQQQRHECLSAECTPPQLKLYQTFIFATPILFTLVLLLLFCLLYLRRRRNAAAATQIRAQFFARGLFSSAQDHGLNKSFRDSLPTVAFDDKFAESRSDTQCSVCLGDYQLNDKLLQLPLCGHAFHSDCIDEWLASNSTCPICRTSLLHASKVVPVASSPPPQTASSSSSSSQISSAAAAAAAVVVELESGGSSGRSQQQQDDDDDAVGGGGGASQEHHVVHIER